MTIKLIAQLFIRARLDVRRNYILSQGIRSIMTFCLVWNVHLKVFQISKLFFRGSMNSKCSNHFMKISENTNADFESIVICAVQMF